MRELDEVIGRTAVARSLLLCASASERCRESVAEVCDRVVARCSKREVHALLTEVLRELATEEEVEWAPVVCAVNTISAAFAGIRSKKRHLYVLSSADLSVAVVQKAAGRPESREIIGRILEDASSACVDFGASEASSSDDPETRQALRIHCLRCLGSAYRAILSSAEEEEGKRWRELAAEAARALGVRTLEDLGRTVLALGHAEEQDPVSDACFLGACALSHEYLEEEERSRSGGGGTSPATLMRLASRFFERMLACADAFVEDDLVVAALLSALHLLYSFTSLIENKGGLDRAEAGQDEAIDLLIRMMSHCPDRGVRMRAKYCMTAVFQALRPHQRLVSMKRIAEHCEYPGVRATLISAMKDEVASAWPKAEGAGHLSPFLSEEAVSCVLGPLEDLHRLGDEAAKKDSMVENAEVLLASMNALRFILIRQQKDQADASVLDASRLKTLSQEMLPSIRESIQAKLKDMGWRGVPPSGGGLPGLGVMGGGGLGGLGGGGPQWGCIMGQDPSLCGTTGSAQEEWEKQMLLNVRAMDTVCERLSEILGKFD